MNVSKPTHAREPDCIHSWSRATKKYMQPASACIECSQGSELAQWSADWAAWLAENPDSPEARWVQEQEKRTQQAGEAYDEAPP